MSKFFQTILTSLTFFFCVQVAMAQPALNLSDATVPSESITTINFSTVDFTDITRLQLSFNWNPAELEFISIKDINMETPLNLSENNLDVSDVVNGTLVFNWEDGMDTARTVEDGMKFFSIEFRALIAEGQTAEVIISGTPAEVIVNRPIPGIGIRNIYDPEKVKNGIITTLAPIPDLNFEFVPQQTSDIICKGDQLCYDLKVSGFEFVQGMQFILQWDNSVLEYNGARDFGFNGFNMNTFVVRENDITGQPDSIARALWQAETIEELTDGVTLEDNSNLVTICYDVIGDPNSETTVVLTGDATTSLEIFNKNGEIFDIFVNGEPNVQVADCASLIVFNTDCSNVIKDDTVCIDFQTSNFTDITDARFTLNWDPELLEFVRSENFNLQGLDETNITVNNGVLIFDWSDVSGATLDNGSTLFSGCFRAIGDIDSIAKLNFIDLAGAGYEVKNSSDESLRGQFSGCDIQILPPRIELSAPMLTSPQDEEICIPLTVNNFLNIQRIEMPIEWDPAVLEFKRIETRELVGLTEANFELKDVGDGQLQLVSWGSQDMSLTLPDGSVIFEICFQVLGDLGTSSPVNFPNTEANPVFIRNANNQEPGVDITNGQVSVESLGLLLASEVQTVEKGQSICVDVSANNAQNVLTMDYVHTFDPTAFRFDSAVVSGFSANAVIQEVSAGEIPVSLASSDDVNGTDFDESTVLYTLCFTAIGDFGDCANLGLADNQEVTTVESGGADIGIFNKLEDICVDNFGLTLVDSLLPSCVGGDGRLNLAVSGDAGDRFFYLASKDGESFGSDQDVENNEIILENLSEGVYCFTISSINSGKTRDNICFDLTLGPESLPNISLGEDIDAGCVAEDAPLNIDLDASSFTLPQGTSSTFEIGWRTSGQGVIEAGKEDQEITTVTAAGTYIFTVTINATQCAASDTISVFTTQPPRVQTLPGGILGCVDTTFELGLEIYNPQENDVFLWTTETGNFVTEPTSLNPLVDQEGFYKFTVTDTLNGCVGFDSVFIQVDTFMPTADAGNDLEMGCDDVTLRLTGLGSPGAQYEWTTEDGSSIVYPDANSQDIADVSRVGTYTFVVTNQVNGCQATDEMVINADNSLPVARANNSAIIGCGMEEVTLDGSGSSQGGSFRYRWEDPSNQFISNADSITASNEGNYLLIVTNIDNDDCIADTAIVNVAINKQEPESSISQILTLSCKAECTELSANVPEGDQYVYQWTTEDGVFCEGENDPTVLVKSIGVYRIEVTDLSNNCTSMTAAIVGGDGTEIIADAGPDRQIDCRADMVLLDGRGSTNNDNILFTWKTETDEVISTEITAEVTTPGEYTLEIIDTLNDCQATGLVSVMVDQDIPAAEAGEFEPIDGCEFPTGRRLNGNASEIGPTITYEWTTEGGNIVGPTDITTPEIAGPGTYNLLVTNTANGCTNSDAVVVQSTAIIPIANGGIDKNLTCEEPTTTLAGISEVPAPNSIIRWTTTDGNITSETDQLAVMVDAAGTYLLSITSPDGCVATDEVIVSSEVDAPEANAGQALSITCNQNLIINGVGSTGDNISIEWTTNGGNIVSGGDTYTPEVNRGGSYTLTVTNIDNNCQTTALVIVTDEDNLPVAEAGTNQEICTNEATLNATLPDGDFTGMWSTLEESMVVSSENPNTAVADLTEGANTYVWTLSSPTCGAFSTDTLTVTVPTFPIANDDAFEIQPGVAFTQLDVLANDQLNSEVTVNILTPPVTGELTGLSNGVFEFSSPARYFGTQQFQYEVCSATCSDLCAVANARIVVLPGPDVDTTNTVPNAITPNGDGLNDRLLVDELIFDAVDFPQSEIIIFNRWGDTVFRASPYNNDWDGRSTTGELLPEGTYYYVLRLDISEGEVMKGDVTILR
ncbi:MAG: gliding motility-associated C-terminal domain-containing protein [Bacteroidota bacterium]